MPRFKFANGQEYVPGVYEFGPYVLTNNIEKFRLTMPRKIGETPSGDPIWWPDTGSLLFRLRSWLSYDGGETWNEGAGMGAHGGEVIDPRTGDPVPNAWIEWTLLPQKTGRKARQIKMEVEVFSTFTFEGQASWA